MIAKRALLVGLLALFVVGSAVVPIQAQTQEESVQAGQDEQVFNRIDQPVTVRVTNDNWLDMRIYVVETAAPLAPRHRHGADHGQLRAPRPPGG